MRFVWPAWDKTYFFYVEFANMVWVAVGFVFLKNPRVKRKCALLFGKPLDANRRTVPLLVCGVSFRRACVEENALCARRNDQRCNVKMTKRKLTRPSERQR